MSDEAALLAAIRDNAEDEVTLRLIYADWLDEFATTDVQRARVEFIRSHCAISDRNGRLNAPEVTDEYNELAERVVELRNRYQAEWLAGFPGGDTTEGNPFNFFCGFARDLELTAEQCLIAPVPPWWREPALTVVVSGTVPELLRVLESGWFDGVAGLALKPTEGSGDELAESVARSACADQLGKLKIVSDTFTDVGARAIASSPRLARLRDFQLLGRYSNDGVSALVNAPFAERLTWLFLGNNMGLNNPEDWVQTSQVATTIAAAPQLANLRVLWLGRNGVGSAGVRTLVTSPNLQKLTNLIIDQEDLSDGGDSFAGANLPALDYLTISRSNIPRDLITQLAASNLTRQLVELTLEQTWLDAAAVRLLVSGRSFVRLRRLCLEGNNIGDAGAFLLQNAKCLVRLESLELPQCGVGPKGVRALASAPFASRLLRLNLRKNDISEGGAEVLADTNNFPRLRCLDLADAVTAAEFQEMLAERGDCYVYFE